jgi:hypothetical protein
VVEVGGVHLTPEPASIVLLGLGGLGCLALRMRRLRGSVA